MNAVTMREHRAMQANRQPDRVELREKTLDASAELQRTYRAVSAFRLAHPGWKVPSAYDRPKPIDVELLRSGRGSESHRARAIIAVTAPTPEIRALQAELKSFADAAPNPNQSRLLISLLVDRYPNQRAHEPRMYLAGLIHQVEQGRYTPPMVAWACDAVLLTSKFLPSPAEFGEALGKARWPGIAATEVDRALELREQAETALAEAKRLGPHRPEAETEKHKTEL